MSPLYFKEVHYIFYNNINKLQIELLYALIHITIGLESIKDNLFFHFMNPLNYSQRCRLGRIRLLGVDLILHLATFGDK